MPRRTARSRCCGSRVAPPTRCSASTASSRTWLKSEERGIHRAGSRRHRPRVAALAPEPCRLRAKGISAGDEVARPPYGVRHSIESPDLVRADDATVRHPVRRPQRARRLDAVDGLDADGRRCSGPLAAKCAGDGTPDAAQRAPAAEAGERAAGLLAVRSRPRSKPASSRSRSAARRRNWRVRSVRSSRRPGCVSWSSGP